MGLLSLQYGDVWRMNWGNSGFTEYTFKTHLPYIRNMIDDVSLVYCSLQLSLRISNNAPRNLICILYNLKKSGVQLRDGNNNNWWSSGNDNHLVWPIIDFENKGWMNTLHKNSYTYIYFFLCHILQHRFIEPYIYFRRGKIFISSG